MDSFSCSFWGHRSENWKKNILSTAEAKFLNNSATAVMSLQKLKHQATVIQFLSMYVCGCPMGRTAFK